MFSYVIIGGQLTCVAAEKIAPVSSPPARGGPVNARSSPSPRCAGTTLRAESVDVVINIDEINFLKSQTLSQFTCFNFLFQLLPFLLQVFQRLLVADLLLSKLLQVKNDVFYLEISRHCFIIQDGGGRQVSCGTREYYFNEVNCLRLEECTSLSYSSSSWWDNWVSAAKETSLAALSATKRDLAEFVTVLKTDTEAAVTGATASLKTLLVRRCSPWYM